MKLTWSTSDQIVFYDKATGTFAATFTLQPESAGLASGTFTTQEDFDDTKQYDVRYPAISSATTLTDYTASRTTKLASNQIQTGGTTDHLGPLFFTNGEFAKTGITFKHTVLILTLSISKPSESGDGESLTKIGFSNGPENYALTLTDFDWTQKAYLVIEPATGTRDLRFFGTTIAGTTKQSYYFTVNTSNVYEVRKCYTATIAADKFKLTNQMTLTITRVKTRTM